MNKLRRLPTLTLLATLTVTLLASPRLHAQVQPTETAPPPAALASVPTHKRLRLAVYKGAGAGEAGRKVLINALTRDPNISVEDITVEDIRAGKLDGFDAVVHPGGSGGGQGKALGEEGRAKIQAFVRGGGGYLGVCAGAYLATNDYPWGLGILNARVLDKAHWARGTGPVAVAPTAKGKELLATDGAALTIIYWQGPLLAPGKDTNLPAYEELATYQGEIAKKGAPRGVMPGTTAIAAAPFGAGRVVCFSPHPEKTAGQEPLLHHAVLWATRSAPAATALKP